LQSTLHRIGVGLVLSYSLFSLSRRLVVTAMIVGVDYRALNVSVDPQIFKVRIQRGHPVMRQECVYR
jgi:HSP20 family molecular chaperone IbpA